MTGHAPPGGPNYISARAARRGGVANICACVLVFARRDVCGMRRGFRILVFEAITEIRKEVWFMRVLVKYVQIQAHRSNIQQRDGRSSHLVSRARPSRKERVWPARPRHIAHFLLYTIFIFHSMNKQQQQAVKQGGTLIIWFDSR